ncbi:MULTISPECIES: hypothetical protein [unclassified Burkholderia]|uniref:hypothetical protein n=1 Tax=unclassified Burkholderia TaxID=2613784 RepID=UPI002AB0D7DD|nr:MULTISPECIES: hypothetical protein [unclassified Burkholderia]
MTEHSKDSTTTATNSGIVGIRLTLREDGAVIERDFPGAVRYALVNDGSNRAILTLYDGDGKTMSSCYPEKLVNPPQLNRFERDWLWLDFDRVSHDAADAFWARFVTHFPEMLSGDSNIAGEDVGALRFWLADDVGDNPEEPFFVDASEFEAWGVTPQRVSVALDDALEAAAAILTVANQELPTVPTHTREMLHLCVQHQIAMNYPRANDGEVTHG